jgi:hypothetical protein
VTEFTSRRENGRQRPRGYADWRPQAKTRVLLEQVQHVFAAYKDYLPLTVRQVFYALVAGFAYAKTDTPTSGSASTSYALAGPR